MPKGFGLPVNTPSRWKKSLKFITEEFYKRYWFYHPVQCAKGVYARRPMRMNGDTEVYKCPGKTIQTFRRFLKPNNFFRYKYGRGGEFAQGLFAVLKKLGVRCRLILGYWHGSDALWVEAFNPWTRRWVFLDPAFKKGYGHKFPKAGMLRVIALETNNGNIVNRTLVYAR
jgi:hypothetical protein